MTAKDILEELKPLGSNGYKKVMSTYGVKEPFFGVKIGDVQPIRKRIRKDYQLALDLYATGNYDAMYLAGLIADDERMTRDDLRNWVSNAYCGPLCGSTVPSVAAGSPHGWELALEWIDSESDLIAAAGWATLACIVSVRPDSGLDLPVLKRLLRRVVETIHQAPDVARYQMNAFIIAVGSYVPPLTGDAVLAAENVGPVTADLGNNSCQVPYAPSSIEKVRSRGAIGKKRKSAKC
jgi:hypothetical protein